MENLQRDLNPNLLQTVALVALALMTASLPPQKLLRWTAPVVNLAPGIWRQSKPLAVMVPVLP